MIRRSTWILLAVFVVLLGAFIVFQRRETAQVEETTEIPVLETPEPVNDLFDIPEGEAILGLMVKDAAGNLVEIGRTDESAAWELVTPQDEADSDRIDQVISQIETIRIDSTLDAGLALDAVGLDQPAYTLRLTLSNGKKLTVYVGEATISGSGYYARLAGGSTVVVGKYAVDQVVNLLSTPPILSTPTPSPEPSEGVE